MYFVYLLESTTSGRTYVGCTNNLTRRLRQHNGDLTGGARSTRSGRPWVRVGHVSGFPDYRSALQFEWKWKHMGRVRGRGTARRVRLLTRLLQLRCWTRNALPACVYQLGVHLDPCLLPYFRECDTCFGTTVTVDTDGTTR